MKKIKQQKIHIFNVSGGIGKNIAATSVVKALKEKFPMDRIVVLTAYRDVWLFNPNVYQVHDINNTTYFYDTFIKNNEDNVVIHALDPYRTSDYILGRDSLLEAWYKLCGIENDAIYQPELFFNRREVEYVKNNYVKNPYFIIQTHGGLNPAMKHSWARDIPMDIAQSVVDIMSKRMQVIHIRREDQPALQNCDVFQGTQREIWLLIMFSTKRLFNDSMCQHAAAALSKESTVLWIANKPSQLGYDLHTNIECDIPFSLNSTSKAILEPYNILGDVLECPFELNMSVPRPMFDVDDIIASIESQKN